MTNPRQAMPMAAIHIVHLCPQRAQCRLPRIRLSRPCGVTATCAFDKWARDPFGATKSGASDRAFVLESLIASLPCVTRASDGSSRVMAM
jgi:hypothetical protein